MPESDLSLTEFARIVGVNRETVWRNVRSGKIPAFRVGRQWRIRRDVIEALRNGQSSQATSATK